MVSDKGKWLPIFLGVIGLAIQLFWIYLQIQHWKEPDADYMAIALNIAVSVALWLILGYLVFYNWNVRKTLNASRGVLEKRVLFQLCYHWSRLLSGYRRLDFDDRDHCRLPFAHSSWPSFGQPWSYTNVQLFTMSRQIEELAQDSKELMALFEWPDWSDLKIPRRDQHTVMVDALSQMQDLVSYLKSKIPIADQATAPNSSRTLQA
ncbi:MAG TPA: hypothetical protein VLM42_08815 [Bryobacteraceae bacterium]|nr:hypothetical protein [Bryobacteraceae bacterium]